MESAADLSVTLDERMNRIFCGKMRAARDEDDVGTGLGRCRTKSTSQTCISSDRPLAAACWTCDSK
jgi:hypothetical protein